MKNVSYYRHLHPESLKKLVAITKITAVSLLTVLPSTMQAEPTYSQSVVISKLNGCFSPTCFHR